MTISSTIPVSSTPTMEEHLWAMAYLFRSTWQEGIVTSTRYETSIEMASDGGEKRVGLRDRGILSIQASFTASTQTEVMRLRMLAQRLGKARSLFPAYSDISRLLEPAEVGTELVCETEHRRFAPGQRVIIFRDGQEEELGQESDQFDVIEISAVSPTGITLQSPVTRPWARGTIVAPLIEARLTIDPTGKVMTDGVATLSVRAVEATSEAQLASPTGGDFHTYQDLPIFPDRIDYSNVEWGPISHVSSETLNIDLIEETIGSRPRQRYAVQVSSESREKAWEVVRFFHRCKGSLKPFWMLSPMSEYSGTLTDKETLETPIVGPLNDWSFRPFVGIRYKDGTLAVRSVQSVVRGAATDVVTFDDDFPSVSDIERICIASLCRFDTDELVETWVTDSVMSTTLVAVELLEEKEVSIPNLTILESTGAGFRFALGECLPGDPGGGDCDYCGEIGYSKEAVVSFYLRDYECFGGEANWFNGEEFYDSGTLARGELGGLPYFSTDTLRQEYWQADDACPPSESESPTLYDLNENGSTSIRYNCETDRWQRSTGSSGWFDLPIDGETTWTPYEYHHEKDKIEEGHVYGHTQIDIVVANNNC